MIDNATMKLLEKCANGIGCHLCIYKGIEDCKGALLNAVDICMPTLINTVKADTVKEFARECADRFKQRENEKSCSWCIHSTSFGNRARDCDMDNGNGRVRCFFFDRWESCVDNIIDNLVKEFTEGG